MEKIKNKKRKSLKVIIRKNIGAWLIMLPCLILFAFFVWLPMLKNFGLSFFNDYSFSEFEGFSNYIEIFKDDSFLIKNKVVTVIH